MITSNLKRIMEEKKLSIRALAEMANLANGSIERARSDELIGRCSLETLEAIAAVLGVKISDLYNESGKKYKKGGLQITGDLLLEGLDHDAVLKKMRQFAGTETASEVAKRLQAEHAEMIRKVAEEAAFNAVVELERKLEKQREEQEEAIKKAGFPPVGSIF